MAKKRGEGGLVQVGELVTNLFSDAELPEQTAPAKPVTPRQLKRANHVVAIREQREDYDNQQRIGYLARPFVLCGLPFKKPGKTVTHYKRENGNEVFEITASPEHGLPFGMDFEVLIWVSTLAKRAMNKNGGKCPRVLEFASGAEFLKAFDLAKDGRTYERAQQRFLRVFYSTFFFGKKNQHRAKMFRVHFFDAIDLWFTKDLDTQPLPGEDFKNNRIVLSEAFAADLERMLIPIELETVTAWANNPTQVYFNLWLGWRCYSAKGGERIPLMGSEGLKEQCGFEGYDGERGPRRFRQKIKQLLENAKQSWPGCPVHLETNEPPKSDYLVIERAASPIRRSLPKRG